jgi:hypothetical protein
MRKQNITNKWRERKWGTEDKLNRDWKIKDTYSRKWEVTMKETEEGG